MRIAIASMAILTGLAYALLAIMIKIKELSPLINF